MLPDKPLAGFSRRVGGLITCSARAGLCARPHQLRRPPPVWRWIKGHTHAIAAASANARQALFDAYVKGASMRSPHRCWIAVASATRRTSGAQFRRDGSRIWRRNSSSAFAPDQAKINLNQTILQLSDNQQKGRRVATAGPTFSRPLAVRTDIGHLASERGQVDRLRYRQSGCGNLPRRTNRQLQRLTQRGQVFLARAGFAGLPKIDTRSGDSDHSCDLGHA